MSGLLKTIAAALLAAAAPGAALAQTWTDWGEAEGRALVAAENGVVDDITYEDGGLRLWATFDEWLPMVLIGAECEGVGAKMRCKTLGFNGLFEVNDAARSRELEARLSYHYVADVAQDEDLVIHRQVELEGGASLANIRVQLNGFIIVSELIYAEVWPSKEGGTAAPATPPKTSR